MAAARRVVVLGFDDVQSLDMIGPVEVFDVATRHGIVPPYRVEVVGPTAAPITTSSGITLTPARGLGDGRSHIDTLVIAGGTGVTTQLENVELITAVRREARRARRVASVCTGAFILAEAGLLDGRRVTTHWSACRRLARAYPEITVDPDPIFVRDGHVSTSAGVTAGIDLCLALVEEDHGRDLALSVARQLVVFLKRPGGQAQFSSHLSAQLAERDGLAEVQGWIADHLDDDLSVTRLARPRLDEPTALRPALPGRDRGDARALRRARPGRAGPTAARGVACRDRGDRARLWLRHAGDDAARLPALLVGGPDRVPATLPRDGQPESGGLAMGITTGIVLFDGAEELDWAGPWEVFTMARQDGDSVVTIAERLDPVHCAKGLRVLADHTFDGRAAARRPGRPRRGGEPSGGRQPRAPRLDRPGRAPVHLGHQCLHRFVHPARGRTGPEQAGDDPLGLDRTDARHWRT